MFNITVQYTDYISAPVTDYVMNCQFTNNKRTLKQNDMNTKVEIEVITSHIMWNQ